jgi:hypothetical protein
LAGKFFYDIKEKIYLNNSDVLTAAKIKTRQPMKLDDIVFATPEYR